MRMHPCPTDPAALTLVTMNAGPSVRPAPRLKPSSMCAKSPFGWAAGSRPRRGQVEEDVLGSHDGDGGRVDDGLGRPADTRRCRRSEVGKFVTNVSEEGRPIARVENTGHVDGPLGGRLGLFSALFDVSLELSGPIELRDPHPGTFSPYLGHSRCTRSRPALNPWASSIAWILRYPYLGRFVVGSCIFATSGLSVSVFVPLYRCVDRGCPTALHTRRSGISNARIARSTPSRTAAGLSLLPASPFQ